MRFIQMLALSVALVLVAGELSQLALAAEDDQNVVVAVKKKPTKLKRTIRVKETQPAPVPAAEPEQVSEPRNVAMHNTGPTNNVDVQPNISIAAPMPQAQQQQPVVQASGPSAEIPEQSKADTAEPVADQLSPRPAANVEALTNLNQANNKLYTTVLGSNNVQSQGVANSNNYLANLAEGNNNHRQTVVRNSGNTEQVHIDGVGNKKITHVNNVANNEQGPAPPAPCNHSERNVPQASPQLPALIQINMNEVPGQARPPMMVLANDGQPSILPATGYPVIRQMAPQIIYPGAPSIPSMSPQLSPLARDLTFAPPSAMMAQTLPPQMMPPMMVMPAGRQAPFMMAPPSPMMYPQPMFYPWPLPPPPPPAGWWPHGQSAKSVRLARRDRKLMRKLKKSLKKMERHQKRREKSSENDELAGVDPPALAAPAAAATVADERKQPAQKEDAKKPKVVEEEVAEDDETESSPSEALDSEEPEEPAEVEPAVQSVRSDEEEPEEVVEWEMVPRRRRVKRAKTAAAAAPAVAEAAARPVLSAVKDGALSLLKPLGSLAPAPKQ